MSDYSWPGFGATKTEAVSWQPIETAPRDGTLVLLWAYRCEPSGPWHWDAVSSEWHHQLQGPWSHRRVRDE